MSQYWNFVFFSYPDRHERKLKGQNKGSASWVPLERLGVAALVKEPGCNRTTLSLEPFHCRVINPQAAMSPASLRGLLSREKIEKFTDQTLLATSNLPWYASLKQRGSRASLRGPTVAAWQCSTSVTLVSFHRPTCCYTCIQGIHCNLLWEPSDFYTL